MLSSYASNAVLSKARAMYGKRIRESVYSELMSCRSVPEIASYLKNRTSYYEALKSIDEQSIHRGKLEEILRQKLFYDFAKLGRYDLSVGERFFSYIISRAEIEKMMHSLIYLTSKKSGSYNYPLPKIFENHTKINLIMLSSIKNYDEFLLAIKDSPYYKVLLPFSPDSNNDINVTGIETALYTYLYKIMFEMIDRYLKGKDREDLKDLFNSYIDLNNFVRIIRMKRNYSINNNCILSSLLPFGNLSRNHIKNLVYSKSYNEMMSGIKNTKIGRKWIKDELTIDDRTPKIMRFIKCTHNIRFSISPPVVLMSYIFLKEMELSNIINIIEGVRYSVPKEEITFMLIR